MDVVDNQKQKHKEQQNQLQEVENARTSAGADMILNEASNKATRMDLSTPQESSTASPVECLAAASSTTTNTLKPVQEETVQDTHKGPSNPPNNNTHATKQPSSTTESTTDAPPASSSTIITDAAKETRIIDTDKAPPMPAQVTSVIQASPSRRVVFSPDKRESCLSIPNNTNIPKLKGILKTTTKPVGKLDMSKIILPTEEEIANNRPIVKRKNKPVQKNITTRMLEARITGNKPKVLEHPFSDSPFIGSSNSALTFAASPAKVLDPFIRESIEKLKSQDLAVRKETYDSMLDTLRTSKDKTYHDEIHESIRPLTARILIDLDHGNNETVV